jgi:hypothetical protein
MPGFARPDPSSLCRQYVACGHMHRPNPPVSARLSSRGHPAVRGAEVHLLPQAWRNQACAGLFVGAAVTDYLDGYLARKWNLSSAFGAFLDPVADKVVRLQCGGVRLQCVGGPILVAAPS